MIICTRCYGKGLGVPGNRKHPWVWPCIHTHKHSTYTPTQPNINSYLVLLFIHIITQNLQTVLKIYTGSYLECQEIYFMIWKSVNTFIIRSVHFLESTVTPGTRDGLLISLPRKSLRCLMSLYLLLFPIHRYKQQFSITV